MSHRAGLELWWHPAIPFHQSRMKLKDEGLLRIPVNPSPVQHLGVSREMLNPAEMT